MAQYSYTNKALIGNWYEDRLDKSYAPIPELERTGKYRVTPLKMIETTPDLYVTTHQSFHNAATPLVAPPPPTFLNRDTLALALHERRLPGDVPRSGFACPLPRHDAAHDKRLLCTTTHSEFGGRDADCEEKRKRSAQIRPMEQSEDAAAGKVLPTHARASGIRTGGMTDERLQLGSSTDPKSHSFVQRAWLGHASLQEHVASAPQYAQKRKQESNAPGLALKGLGEQSERKNATVLPNGEVRYFKKNDALRRDTGIWSE